MPPIVAVVVLATTGLVVGSFLNVCIYRLPRGESVVWPASRCTSCDRPLSWFENIPVAGWAVLGGRCRTCKARIPAIYPIVEVMTAVLWVGAYVAWGWTPLLALRLVFICALIVLFAIDLEHQILPNVITIPGTVVGLAASLVLPPGWTSSAIGLAAGGLFPFAVAEAYARVRGRVGMGMGDFKMLAMVGAFLGWPLIWMTIIISCVLGVVIGGGGLLVSRRGVWATKIPFGTFIAVAALICAFWEGPVIEGYQRAIAAYLTWAGIV